MNNFAGRINDLKGITLPGGRHKGLIVLVTNIQLVLNCIPGFIDSLGRGSPGVNVA